MSRRSPARPGQKGPPENKLSPPQIEALRGVYACGTAELGRPWSIPEIARAWWLPLGYSTPGAAAEGISKQFKRHGIKLRDANERATLTAQTRGTGPPPPTELAVFLERRRKLILKGLKLRRKRQKPLTESDCWTILRGWTGERNEALKYHFGSDGPAAYSIAVELAALAADDGPLAAPHDVHLLEMEREDRKNEAFWDRLADPLPL